MDTRNALLEAIRLDPDNDVIRLGFADAIQGEYRRDREEGDIDDQWATLIRMQIQEYPNVRDKHDSCLMRDLSSRDPEKREAVKELKEYLARERSLIRDLRPQLCPLCPVCNGSGYVWPSPLPIRTCEQCYGRGYIGEIDKGFCVSVNVPTLSVLFDHAPAVLTRVRGRSKLSRQEIWEPTSWARDLMQKCPVLQRITCISAFDPGTNDLYEGVLEKNLIFKRLEKGKEIWEYDGSRLRRYRSINEGVADLSQAVIATLREMVLESVS